MINQHELNCITAPTWARMLAFACVALIFGCGGSGSGSDIQSGVFIDAPVMGVSYSTPTQTGTTDADGRFRYLTGETVTFSLGRLALGSAAGASQITLFDLAGIDSPPSNQKVFETLFFSTAIPYGPMHRVTNTAMLLQTLDTDANPDNGIRIEAAVAALLPSDEINLDRPYWEALTGGNFRDGRGLLGVLRVADADGLLTPRPIRSPVLALTHVLDQLNIEVGIDGYARQTRDDNADGAVDWARSLTYTADGKVAEDAYDSDGDGVTDRLFQYAYDDNLQQTLYTRDDNADGAAESRTVIDLDVFGNLARKEVFDAAGARVSLETLDFDSLGRLVRREVISEQNHTIQHWIVDEDGFRSTYELDTDGDGAIDRRDLLQYNGGFRSDLWVQRDIDSNLDGVLDAQQLRTYDDQNRLLTDRRDEDLDGTNDYVLTATYDAFGQSSVDRSGSAASPYHNRQIRDTQGRLLRNETDADADGNYENVTENTYDGDNLVRSSTDRDGDGQFERSTVYTYDASGNRLTSAVDSNGDGIVNALTTREYDALGRLTRSTRDDGNDGLADSVEEYSGWASLGLGAWL